MRAAVVDDDRTIRVREISRPECGPGEIRVRVDACGLCGSDLHFFHARSWDPGLIPGHEITGRIEAIGDRPPDVVARRGLGVGSAVVVEPIESCGVCVGCRAGRSSICPELRLAGVSRAGGFAEAIVMPAERIHPIAEDLEPALAALAEPLAVGLHGLERGDLGTDDRVLVLGGGTIGIVTALAARLAGAREVVVRARHPHQREFAREVAGADARDASETIEADGLASGFDLVMESVGGVSETLVEAARAAAPGGRVVVLGLFDPSPPFAPFEALTKELSFHWSNCYCTQANQTEAPDSSDFSRAAQILSNSRDRLAPLVTHRVPLEEIGAAFEIAGDKRRGVGKLSVVRP